MKPVDWLNIRLKHWVYVTQWTVCCLHCLTVISSHYPEQQWTVLTVNNHNIIENKMNKIPVFNYRPTLRQHYNRCSWATLMWVEFPVVSGVVFWNTLHITKRHIEMTNIPHHRWLAGSIWMPNFEFLAATVPEILIWINRRRCKLAHLDCMLQHGWHPLKWMAILSTRRDDGNAPRRWLYSVYKLIICVVIWGYSSIVFLIQETSQERIYIFFTTLPARCKLNARRTLAEKMEFHGFGSLNAHQYVGQKSSQRRHDVVEHSSGRVSMEFGYRRIAGNVWHQPSRQSHGMTNTRSTIIMKCPKCPSCEDVSDQR